MTTLAFDVYGTLIATGGITTTLATMIGDNATAFSNLWRTKQLEYSWRRGLMASYQNFRVCTRQALDFCCLQLGHNLSDSEREKLMAAYLSLPVFDDVKPGLERLKAAGVGMYAFSNGVPDDLETLLNNAGIRNILDGVVSVDDRQTFKPNPLLYDYFSEVTDTEKGEAWLISSNGFDICGAVAAGMHAVWLQRDPSVQFDVWDEQPDKIVSTFGEMVDLFL